MIIIDIDRYEYRMIHIDTDIENFIYIDIDICCNKSKPDHLEPFLVSGYAATALNVLASFDPRRRKRIKPIAVEVQNHALWCEVCQA